MFLDGIGFLMLIMINFYIAAAQHCLIRLEGAQSETGDGDAVGSADCWNLSIKPKVSTI
jgi:hypothetical protein